MSSERPNPDELLARVQADEAKRARGKLKIFFGAAPGVGKTYAMLEAARQLAREGGDVLVGYIEPHVRTETQALVLGLDVLERRIVTYRGREFAEFDLDAALRRHPPLILVDELAHTNVVSENETRLVHTKRWQDIQQLLDAGIDVYTTLNVQHLESANDVVAKITGVVVRETVPDSVFEQADEVELVDLAPDDLIERLRDGKVYVPGQATRAVENFFNKGNLIALREIALRRMAERVDLQMAEYRADHAIAKTWPAAERLLVCIGPGPTSASLVRATRRMAAGLRAPWYAVHVETVADANLALADRERLEATKHLAEQLGAEVVTLAGTDVAEELIAFSRQHNVTKIVVGKPAMPRWREWLRGSFVYEMTRRSGDIDLYVITGTESHGRRRHVRDVPRSSREYVFAVSVVATCTALSWLAFPYFAPVNLVMVYLAGVLIISLRSGRGPSIIASILSVAAFDFAFVPPYLSFAVSDTQYVFTFAVMLATGLLISTLTGHVKFQVESARRREQRTATLYAMTRELVYASSLNELGEIVGQHLKGWQEADVVLLVRRDRIAIGIGEMEPLVTTGETLDEREYSVATWVLEHGEVAGLGTETLPSTRSLFVPLSTPRGHVGVLSVRPRTEQRPFSLDDIQLLETFASQIALVVERVRSMEDAQRQRLQLEAERLRNSLLSAVSHDLRTPLAAIAGASSTLVETGPALSESARSELAESILTEADRLNRLVANLLEMTRLGSGSLLLHREWHSPGELVGAALHRLSRLLAGRSVSVDVSADLPSIWLDELLFHQVLANVLENAARHTTAGSPIEITAKYTDDGFVLEIADRGPGFVSGDETRVFEKFYQRVFDDLAASGSSVTTGRRGGAGLGLAICRGIMDLHGGKISARNRDGGGAVFRIELPQHQPPPPMPTDS